MSDGARPEPDPQTFLPADLRPAWAVVPRATLYWLFAAGAALGAGAALSGVGFALGHDGLRWGFAAALALVVLGRAVVVRAERGRQAALRGRA